MSVSGPSPLTTLALDVLMARGVQSHVVSDMWMQREVSAWLTDPVMIGALARWLTGRPWARGDRVAQVLFEADFTGARIHELWRLMQKAKRHRLTQGHVDFSMRTAGPRRLNEWYKSLRMLRMYGTVRAD